MACFFFTRRSYAESLLGDHWLRWYLNHAGWIGSLSSSAHDHLRLLRQASGGPSAVDVDLPPSMAWG